MSEFILATKEENLKELLETGNKNLFPVYSKVLDIKYDTVIRRKPDAETAGCGFVHPITYCVVTHNGKVLSYQRTTKGGEGRLHGQFSIGVGGHIDVQDQLFDPTEYDSNEIVFNHIFDAAFRELKEELSIDCDDIFAHDLLGVIHNKDTEVNALHIGYVVEVQLTDLGYKKIIDNPEIEDHLCNVNFIFASEVMSDNKLSDYESWSQYLLNDILDGHTRKASESDDESASVLNWNL